MIASFLPVPAQRKKKANGGGRKWRGMGREWRVGGGRGG